MSIIDDIEAGIRYLESLVGNVRDNIDATLRGVVAAAENDLSGMIAPLEAGVINIEQTVGNIGQTITDAISKGLGGILPGAIEILTGLLGDLRTFLEKLAGSITSTETILATSIAEIAKQGPRLEGFIAQAFTTPLIAGLGGFMEMMERAAPEAIDPWLDKMLAIEGLPPEFHATVKSLRERGAQWQALAIPALVVSLVLKVSDAMVEPTATIVRQSSRALQPVELIGESEAITAFRRGALSGPELFDELARAGISEKRQAALRTATESWLDPATALKLVHRGFWGQDALQAELEGQGYNGDRAAAIAYANAPLLSEIDILTAMRRGYIPENDALVELTRYGYTMAQAQQKERLTLVLPNMGDLIKFATRRVYEADLVAATNAEAELPDTLIYRGLQVGLTGETVRSHWAAHWTIPNLGEAFEMLHRDVIDTDGLHELMRLNGIHPAYRDHVEAIAYRPLSLRLIRGMYQQGSLDQDGLIRAFRDLGLRHDLIPKAVDYIEKVTAGVKGDQARQLTDGLRREILRMYTQGKVDVSDATFALTDLGFTDQEASFWIVEADFIYHASQVSALEDGIKRLYLKSFLNPDEATARLKAAGINDTVITALFERWNLEKQYQDLSAESHKLRELSSAEITTALEDGILDESTARTMFAHLGYHDAEIDTKIALADYKAQKQRRTELIANMRALYTANVWDRTSTSNNLDAAGLPPLQRDGLLATWDLEKERRTEHLPIATIRDMIKAQFLSDEEATGELRLHRFTDDTIQQLIAFWRLAPTKKGTVTSATP